MSIFKKRLLKWALTWLILVITQITCWVWILGLSFPIWKVLLVQFFSNLVFTINNYALREKKFDKFINDYEKQLEQETK